MSVLPTTTTKKYSETKDAIRMRNARDNARKNMTDESRKEKLAELAKIKRTQRAAKKSLEPVQDKQAKTKAVAVSVKNDECSTEKVSAIGEFVKSLDKIETVKDSHKQEIPKAVAYKVKEKVEKVHTKIASSLNDADIIKRVRESALKLKHEKAPTEDTVKRYLVAIRDVQKELTGRRNRNIDFTNFKDFEGTIDSIINARTKRGDKRPVSLNTQITRIGSLASILKYFQGYEDVAKQYSDMMVSLHDKEMQEREKNEPDANKPLVEWSTIVEKNNHPEFLKNDKERALYAVYTLLPVRRLEDYRTMTVELDTTDLPKTKNYLLVDTRGNLMRFVYGKYKTATHFGEQQIDIPERLSYILLPHVHNTLLGGLLFPSNKNSEFTQGGFSKYVSDTFEKILKVNTTVNSLRKSSISYFLKQPKISVAQKRKFADAMGHTVQTQALYNKFENEPDAEPEVKAKRKRRSGKKPTLHEIYPWL
jgi:hypothetical protein